MSFAAGWSGTNNINNNQYNTAWRMWLGLRPSHRKNKIKRLFNVSR